MKYIKEDLNNLININKLSYREIGRIYNVSDTFIKKIAKKLGVVIPIRKKFPEGFKPSNFGKVKKHICLLCSNEITETYYNKKFCSINHYNQYKSIIKYKNFLNSSESFGKFYNPRIFKKYFLEEQNNKCAICNIEPNWNNKELIFVLDHIDGHCSNNKRNNIRLICPNCDSQLDTFKSKNKGSDRTDRYNRLRQFGTIKNNQI